MRKGSKFTLTLVVVGLMLVITAFLVIQGSGSVLGGVYGSVDAGVSQQGQKLDSGDGLDSSTGDSSDEGSGEGESSTETRSNAEICSGDMMVTCKTLKVTESGGYTCTGGLVRDADGNILRASPPDGYRCEWNVEEREAEWVKK